MKNKLLLQATFFLILGILTLAGVNAQEYDHTVNVPGDKASHIPEAWNNYYLYTDNFEEGQSLLINVAEGEHICWFGGWLAPKGGKVVIQGAGADKTVLVPKPHDSGVGYDDMRFFIFDGAHNPTKFEFVLKDLTLKSFGYAYTQWGGSVINIDGRKNFKVTLENVNFEDLKGPTGIIRANGDTDVELTVDNCYFGNNYTHFMSSSGNIRGLFLIQNNVKFNLRNSTFMSNTARVINRDVEPPVDSEKKHGGIIDVEIWKEFNEIIMSLENNVIINNQVEAEASTTVIQPAINLAPGPGFVDIEMKNNLIIENRRNTTANDVDLYLKDINNITFLTVENNKINKILIDGEESPQIEGLDANIEYSYTHPEIRFTMDGDLPMIKKDDKGVKHVEYGVSVGVKSNIASSSLKAYPNPSDGLFKINLGNKTDNTRYDVYNSIGSLVKSGVFTQDTPYLDLRGNSKGLYILRTYGNTSGSLRLLIN